MKQSSDNLSQATQDHLDANPYAPSHEKEWVRVTLEQTSQAAAKNIL